MFIVTATKGSLMGKIIALNILVTTSHIVPTTVNVTQNYDMNSRITSSMPNCTSLYNIVFLPVLTLMQTKHACHGDS
jgi:hypothetical protein